MLNRFWWVFITVCSKFLHARARYLAGTGLNMFDSQQYASRVSSLSTFTERRIETRGIQKRKPVCFNVNAAYLHCVSICSSYEVAYQVRRVRSVALTSPVSALHDGMCLNSTNTRTPKQSKIHEIKL